MSRQDHALTIAAGDRLVLFTDGLVERRGLTIDDGFAVIRSAAAETTGRSADELADALMACAPATGRTDDVALLAVLTGQGTAQRVEAAGQFKTSKS